MLPNNLRQTFNGEILRFLWRQWSQLGVAGSVAFTDSWIIDPEALLMFTMNMGRYDARLFDEVIDWTVQNGRWISLQRLKNIAGSVDTRTRQTLAAFASVVDSRDSKHRWRTFSQITEPNEKHSVPFFISIGGEPLPLFGEYDLQFEKQGLERTEIVLRNLSATVPMSSSTNLIFALRSLFGLAPRAEVVAYLLTHAGGKASVIARSTTYSYPAITEALSELAQSGQVYVEKRGYYSIDKERWQQFLNIPSPLPVWIGWQQVFTALLLLVQFLEETSEIAVSDYLLSSRSITLNEKIRVVLSDSGLHNPFLRPVTLDNAAGELAQRVVEMISLLNIDTSIHKTILER